DVAVDFDIAAESAREPDRSRGREVFREYELRDPLRRLEEALGDPELAAPAPAAEVKLGGRLRGGEPDAIVRLGAESDELALVVRKAEAPALVPPGLTHDTLLGAFLLEPARRRFPFGELCEERGLASELDDPLAADAVLLRALAAWQRAQISERGLDGVMRDIELPLIAVLREMELL